MTSSVQTIRRAVPARDLVRITGGFILIYGVLEASATWTNSRYGEYGLVICAAVITTALLVERWLFATPARSAITALGLGRPNRRGLITALLTGLVLLLYLPISVLATGQVIQLRDGWPWIALGVFLQGGIAEEVLWRGYLFRHLRASNSFWRAAALAMLYMVAQHTLLLWSLPLPVALAAVVVALATSFPLAHLYELNDNTIWGAAIVHWIIQGMLKVFVVPDAHALLVIGGWMVASMVVPYLAMLVRRAAAPEIAITAMFAGWDDRE